MDATTLSGLIDAVYAAGIGARSWHDVIGEITKAFGEQAGVLYEFSPRLHQSRVLGVTPTDPAMLAQYDQYYGSIDSVHQRVVHEPVLEANATHNLMRDGDFERTEFYADYLRRLDLFYAMGSVIRHKAGRTTVFGLQRSRRRGHFDQRSFEAIGILARHVERSLEIAERMQAAVRPSFDDANVGFVLLDAAGKAVFATTTAQRLLELAGIGLRAGRLVAAGGRIGERLDLLLNRLTQGAQAAKAAGDHLDIALPSGGSVSLLAIGPSDALAMPGIEQLACLMVEFHARPRDRATLLHQYFRLTAAEAALAIALAEGRTLRDIAQARGISVNTLRVQLQAIFAKTGCHRQSDLVRLVLRLPAA